MVGETSENVGVILLYNCVYNVFLVCKAPSNVPATTPIKSKS